MTVTNAATHKSPTGVVVSTVDTFMWKLHVTNRHTGLT